MNPKIYTPVVTILDDNDNFDMDGNLKVMEHLIKGGVDGIVPLGSTGEFTSFSMEKKKEYLDEYIQAVEGRAEVLAGTGSIYYKDTIELSNYVLKKGVKGVLVVSEFYYQMSQEDFYHYYSFMAQHIDGTIYIYNYPARTGNSIDGDTVAKLAAEYPNISGLKDSTLDFSHTADIINKVLKIRPDFEVFSGFDNQFLDNHKSGGAGGIGALSNIVPDIWAQWVKAVVNGDQKSIDHWKQKIDVLMQIYSLESNPQKLLKEILKANGMNINTHCRFPYDYLREDSLRIAVGLLKSEFGNM